MKTLLDASAADDLIRRLRGLRQESVPRWGRLTAAQLPCHLADPLRVALGEKTARPLRGPLRLPGIAHAIVWFAPWPRSAPTSPDFLPASGMTDPTGFDHDRAVLADVIGRFVQSDPSRPFAPNPVFGTLSRAAWGRLMWRHIDHHLRQFDK